MGRHLIAAAVVVADTVLFLATHRGWGAVAYALAVTPVVLLRGRSPVAAFVAALALASLTDGSYILLLWSAYQAGQEVLSRTGLAVVAGAGAGGLAVRLAASQNIGALLSTYLVFVALPLLVGLYLAQHRRLVAALDQRNRQLSLRQDLLAERERLRERLRIARDMHDSLGHRLSLVSVQAAALEVSVPVRHRQAVGQLAGSARAAVHELHELVGALRGEEERSLTAEAIGTVVEEFRRAGVPVTLRERGEPRPLSFAAGQAAYRVVEEGLTNAAKHAPNQPVTVTVEWESDTLLLTVTNPLTDPVAGADGGAGHGLADLAGHGLTGLAGHGLAGHGLAISPGGYGPAGHGLAGLAERVRPAGGVLDHRLSDDGFRLFAMLPLADGSPADPVSGQAASFGLEADGLSVVASSGLETEQVADVGRFRTVVLGAAVAVLMFVTLPASLLLGVAQ
ncbi:sensor histidine kinase [Streptosporangium saharense]|uniref:sensor histidine kinase n=1 Tax=Streptosporangium saharense TaxID=1706840 RepID=UPI00344681BA